MGELYGSAINATVKTSAVINKTFTASGSYTVPVGYTKMDLFAVGGGAGGNADGCGGGCPLSIHHPVPALPHLSVESHTSSSQGFV